MAIWLSYSGYKQYKTCPKQYYLKRIKKEEPPVPDSAHNALIGIVVQRVFEEFYNREVWRRGPDTSKILLALAEHYFWEEVDKAYINWNDVTCRFDGPNDVLFEILDIIPKVLTGIKREGFLGPYAKSELKIKVRFGREDFLLGYLDFVIRKTDGTLLILDGKASKHREKYIDETQLHFYALMFYLKYKTLPTKMGFFYYRFADDPEKAMDWIDIDPRRLKELREDIEQVLYEVNKGKYRPKSFPATPVAKHCRFCLWENVCSERLRQKSANSAKRSKNKTETKIDLGDKKSKMIGF